MSMFERTEFLIGVAGIKKLRDSHVAIFGIGGVGGMCTEALARAGVGTITIIDHDAIDESNINRQVIATKDSVGRYKVDVMKERIFSINPSCRVIRRREFFLPENSSEFDFSKYDYVVDAVDTVSAKLSIIENAKMVQTKVISAMGTGNKMHPELFMVSDISKTSVCPLARVMRRELGRKGIKDVKCVYSKEPAIKNGKTVGSISFVPPVAGMIMAGEVVKDLIDWKDEVK